MRGIERAAGEQFRALGMVEIAEDEPLPVDELAGFSADGRAWTAVDADGTPVGYLLVKRVGANAHVEQVSVHPSCARQGIGRRLLEAAADWGRGQGLGNLTLTTFSEVPWNAPYYRRLGFRDLPDDALEPGLQQVVAEEAAAGLARWPRVVLSRPLA
ncbi:GNAT family N-acetyltransferase [Arthrobacter sp. MSA 4-2]|uniref:GNAT family N-acetyltransferase n=1 Tax=Arthrobacter sp. MSA 4-2 TaxID=2794349 RepID=UPI0018E83893|nr:GNAT family N-acetyltransferase [Arthrobacter sp. MSA 4-2]MBJ2120829.1 GNAT family N-acetyltransferase [Arthrobacter sp. MSA 4-2]